MLQAVFVAIPGWKFRIEYVVQDANKDDGDAAKSTTAEDADTSTLFRVCTYYTLPIPYL